MQLMRIFAKIDTFCDFYALGCHVVENAELAQSEQRIFRLIGCAFHEDALQLECPMFDEVFARPQYSIVKEQADGVSFGRPPSIFILVGRCGIGDRLNFLWPGQR